MKTCISLSHCTSLNSAIMCYESPAYINFVHLKQLSSPYFNRHSQPLVKWRHLYHNEAFLSLSLSLFRLCSYTWHSTFKQRSRDRANCDVLFKLAHLNWNRDITVHNPVDDKCVTEFKGQWLSKSGHFWGDLSSSIQVKIAMTLCLQHYAGNRQNKRGPALSPQC